MKQSRCGYVAIIGRPNVGKSTLLNQLVGKKISITTTKPQTTRVQILGIKTNNLTQTIYIDTPGIHQAEKRAMNRYMNRLASSVIDDADVIVFMVGAKQWQADDELVLQKLSQANAPVILVINKIDLIKDKRQLLTLIDRFQTKYAFNAIVPMSARNQNDVEKLQDIIAKQLPEGPHLFPDEQITDKNIQFQMAELIREKVINATVQELPYSTYVVIESTQEKGKIMHINAIIWVEREGQKPIVIGKKGERLKKIGIQARKELEKLLNQSVYLRLWVKVKSDWSNNERLLQNLG